MLHAEKQFLGGLCHAWMTDGGSSCQLTRLNSNCPGHLLGAKHAAERLQRCWAQPMSFSIKHLRKSFQVCSLLFPPCPSYPPWSFVIARPLAEHPGRMACGAVAV